MNLEGLIITEWRLGEGSFGAVFVGELGEKKVAAKKLPRLEKEFNSLTREASKLKRLRHGKHIAYTYGIITRDKNLYMAMEYCERGDLQNYLKRNKKSVTYEKRILFCRGILLGLLYCHSMEIFHGDIKCSNVILGKNMEPKLTDFGLNMTMDNLMYYNKIHKGNMYWTAPELFSIQDEAVYREFIADPYLCDIYSLGATFCEISYDGTTEFLDSKDIKTYISSGLISPIPKDAFLDEIIDKCCKFDRNERISLDECLYALDTVAETQLPIPAVDNKWLRIQQDIQANSKLEFPPSFILYRPARNFVVGPPNLSLTEWMCINNCKDAAEYLIRMHKPEAKQLEWLYGISKLCKSQEVVDFLQSVMQNIEHSDLSLADLTNVNSWQFIESLTKAGAHYCNCSPLRKAIEAQCNKFVQSLVDGSIKFDNWAIFDAIRSKNSEAVRIFASTGVDLEYIDSHTGNTPLLAAVRAGNTEIVRILLEFNIDIQKGGQHAPLYRAAIKGNHEIVEILINAGATMDIESRLWQLLVQDLEQQGKVEMVQFILNAMSNSGIKKEKKSTSLCAAIQNGQLDLAQTYIDHKVDIHERNYDGYLPLHWAVIISNEEIVKILVRAGANTDTKTPDGDGSFYSWSSPKYFNECTPLHIATVKGHLGIVKFLIASGADFSAVNGLGQKIVEIANEKDREEITSIIQKFAPAAPISLYRAVASMGIKTVEILINRQQTNINTLSESLCIASFYGNTEAVVCLLKYGVDTNMEFEGQTPLEWAKSEDHTEIVQILTKAGTSLFVNDECVNSLLFQYVKESKIDMVQFLLENGADVNARSKFDYTPIYYAKNKEIAEILIKAGANFSANDECVNSLLFQYVKESKIDMVQFLLEKGADVNVGDKDGYALIHYVDNREIAEILISHGADINTKSTNEMTPLSYCVYKSRVDMVQFLVEKGADVNAKNKDGFAPIHYAKNREIAEFLISYGADINAKSVNGRTPLFECVGKSLVDMVQFLVEKGADVNTRSKLGYTPIHHAKSKEVAEILITHGADINAKSTNGMTPLLRYADKSLVDMVQFLVEKGADVNAGNKDGFTPIHHAKNKEIAETLITHGADINAKSISGRTPLFECVDKSLVDIVQLLIENGADVNASSKRGYTPIHCVRNKEIAEILIKAGANIE